MVIAVRVLLAAMTGMGNAALGALQRAGIDVVAVITDPRASPGFPHYPCEELSAACARRDVAVWANLRLDGPDAVERIAACRADALVIATSPKIVSDEVVHALEGRVINCHPSLLPRHRGPTPIPWTIECGDQETGLTFIRPTAVLDAGPVWSQCRTRIDGEETAGELRYRLDHVLLPQVLPEVVRGVVTSRLTAELQTGEASREKRFDAVVGDVDWRTMSVVACLRRFRARTPYPGAHVAIDGHECRLTRLRRAGEETLGPPGTVRRNHLGVVMIDVVDGRLIGACAAEG